MSAVLSSASAVAEAGKGKPVRVPGSATGGHVVVVGTGVVGLSAALGCAQAGSPVSLVGPVPSAAAAPPGGAWDARIYALSPAAVRLLARQRVWPQVDAARVCAVEQMQVMGDDGGHLRFDAQSAGVARLATICEESQLLRALWLACGLAPGIDHRARAFAGLSRAAAGASTAAGAAAGPIQVRLDDGQVLDADLLIGADGRLSSVRAAAGIGARLSGYGQTAIVANFAAQRPHDGIARQWFTDEGIVALLPLPGNVVSLVWSAPQALLAPLLALDEAAFTQRLEQRCAKALGGLQMLGQRHTFPLHRAIVDRLAQPGIALMGDAAHVVHPLAGQGLNLGLQDVSEFLRCLESREAWRGPGDAVLLRRYERARAEPIAMMRGTVDSLARLFGLGGSPARQLRNAGMTLVDAVLPLKNALIRHAMG